MKFSGVFPTPIVQDGVRFWKDASVTESEIGYGSSVGDNAILRYCTLAERVEIGRRNTLDHVEIGTGTYSGEFTIAKYVSIGKYCAISWNVSIGGANHELHHLALTPVHRILQEKDAQGGYLSWKTQNCSIGHDVWLAAGCHILRGVSVGNGAVVAANSVVTKDVPPYAIVAGIPAKIIKFRFSEEIIQGLLEVRWWDFPLDVLRSQCRDLLSREVSADDVQKLAEIRSGL